MTKTEEKTIRDMQTDIDFLVSKYGKLEVATRSLQKRVEELEQESYNAFSTEDLSYLKGLVTTRKAVFKEEVKHVEITPSTVPFIQEEQERIDDLLSKILIALSK